jgi:predicted MFS family arabinose efflux permease
MAAPPVAAALRTRLGAPSIVVFACLFTSQAALLVLSPILPEIAQEFGRTTAEAGQLRTVSGAVGGLVAVGLALAGRRPGLRTLLSAGAGLVLAGAVASAAAPAFAVLVGAQALLGAGIGLLVAVGIAAAGEWSAPGERARTLAWAIAGMPVAWVVGMPLAGAAGTLGWRFTWLAVPALAALATLGLLRLRPADPRSVRRGTAASPWRRPGVARFTFGELAANAAWAGVLTYGGSLLIERHHASAATVALGLGVMAAVMVPGTILGRHRDAHATPALLVALTLVQAGMVVALTAAAPGALSALAVLSVGAFINGWRSMLASSLGMDAAPDDKVAVMALRAAANQFGYLVGAATGGIALAFGGFPALGAVFAALFVFGAAAHVPPRRRSGPVVVAAPHRVEVRAGG